LLSEMGMTMTMILDEVGMWSWKIEGEIDSACVPESESGAYACS
jgi:hypothetical protein